MHETKMLTGSLSNDLFRVASLTQRGAVESSTRFAQESKKWAIPLAKKDVPQYIKNIAEEVSGSDNRVSLQQAEKYLMYAVLLQNYTLHL